MRICVIDDERVTLTVIKAALAQVGTYEVECFSEPHAALSHCAKVTFDIVLIDYRMMDMNGVEAVLHLRSAAEYTHVPIIMLTADNDRDLRLAAISAGATDFLNKPFDPDELRIRVRNLLHMRKAQLALMDRAKNLDQEVKWAVHKLA